MNHRTYVLLSVIIIAIPVLFPLFGAEAGTNYKNPTDYKNPMRLNLELLDGKSVSGSKDAPYQHDYYESEGARKWAENYHMKPGIQRMNERHFTSAFDEFDFVLRYIPNHPRALTFMGDLTILMKRPELGDNYFKKAFALYPKTAKAESYKDYGRFLYLSGNYEGAVQALEKSLQMDPKLSLAHYFLGLTHCATKNFVRANYHAQIIYSKGFPLSELREKLIAANAWSPDHVNADGKRPGQSDIQNNNQGH